MGRRRFKELGTGSFPGEWVYDRVVPENNFLRQLEALVEWQVFTEKLLRLYKGGRGGRTPTV